MSAEPSPTAGSKRRILVTSALPYINGPIHLGHIVETIQTDIWVRFQRMCGHECYYVCADDTHGTATLLRAEREGVEPEDLIRRTSEEHQRDYAGFGVEFDTFYSTHAPENRRLVEGIYSGLEQGDNVFWKSVRQFYDPEREIFLADRFIKGTCPRCGSNDQNGDSCDNCGSTYSPADLIDPRSAISGAAPVERDSDHLFVRLKDFEKVLREWVSTDRLQPEVVNKLEEWFAEGLRDWDVSRDAPYFGFEIPGTGTAERPIKYFYVWVDAPVGYLAAFEKLCRERPGLEFDDFWKPDSTAEVHHFIGKDILYFHCLFWPAMLHAGGYRLPTSVPVHGFLTVDGTKMSKSRGTFVLASTYLEHLPAEPLRYYFAAKFGSGLGDIDLNLRDFVQRVNSDLVGKLVNIASRCSGFLHRLHDGRLSRALHQPELFNDASDAAPEIAQLWEEREYNRAIRRIMAIADDANRYIDEQDPWQLAKDPERHAEVQAICSTGINMFRLLMIYLKPVLPEMARGAETFLQVPPATWDDAREPLVHHVIAKYQPLMTRLDDQSADALIEASKDDQAAALAPHSPSSTGAAKSAVTQTDGTQSDAAAIAVSGDADSGSADPGSAEVAKFAPEPSALALEAEIKIDDFTKIDLRVARILEASDVDGADKLLRLKLDLGSEQRQVFAGIKAAYSAAELTDKLVVVVANLAHRKMRFGVSEGMVLASGEGDAVKLVMPAEGSKPGDRVR